MSSYFNLMIARCAKARAKYLSSGSGIRRDRRRKVNPIFFEQKGQPESMLCLVAKFKITKLSHRMRILHAWSIKSR